MSEKPILFSGEMVNAILEGRKTQTRRVAKLKPLHAGLNFAWTGLEAGHYCTDCPDRGWVLRARRGDGCWEDKTERTYCPYGQVGDRLWVRETWVDLRKYINDVYPNQAPIAYAADDVYLVGEKWRPSIFMPRWASRIVLEITDIRVQRVQEISEKEAIAEGIEYQPAGNAAYHRYHYMLLWDQINSKRGYGWDKNPWVWVINFRVVKP